MRRRIVIIADAVYERLDLYMERIITTSDTTFQVNENRAKEKWNYICDTLHSRLGNPAQSFIETQYYQLGRDFGYHQFSFRGKKSKTQWSFGFEENDKYVIVHIMENAALIKSNKEYSSNLIPESNNELSELLEFHTWMHRLDEVKGARPTFWIEG